ncbi:hypothetical protein JOQ06_018216, partial [Pogonophryne albipinna]
EFSQVPEQRDISITPPPQLQSQDVRPEFWGIGERQLQKPKAGSAAHQAQKRSDSKPQLANGAGLFPQQIPAQSVQSSGGDERWGLGAKATTHFT